MTGLRLCATMACLMTVLLGPAPSDAAAFDDAFRDQLYAGDSGAAAALAEAEIASDPENGTARAALGVARFLGTVEGLIQGFHRHGLNNGRNGFAPLAMAGLPFLRLPVPDNPVPEPVSYEALRGILDTFGKGLADAEAVLADTGDRPVALTLDLAKIRLDLDGDGVSSPGEDLMSVFGAVAGPVAPGDDAAGLVVDFDSADVTWLQAYTHLLMAMTDVILAHDWHEAYDATFEGLFPRSYTPRTALNDYLRALPERMADIEARMPQEPTCERWVNNQVNDECEQQFLDFYRNDAVRERQSLMALAEYSTIADLIAFVHLLRWPVVEPERSAAALGHLESMVALSRETWVRILAETDQGREWLPAPGQAGVFRTLPIDQARVDGWLGFLDQFEKVLKGESLLPHWRFQQGFNLRRMFLEPGTLDVVMMIQGHALLPYLEDGPIADSATWERTIEVFGGDFFSYFIWIN